MKKICFWNNKGGVGKTSLLFQSVCCLAKENQNKNFLVIDLCSQANASEAFLGVSAFNKAIQEEKTLFNYFFEKRLRNPFACPVDVLKDVNILNVYKYSENIPKNINLLSGDSRIEILSPSIQSMSSINLSPVKNWKMILSWIKDLVSAYEKEYDYVFLDTNPSFSIFTQMAILGSDQLVIPLCEDFSSLRGLKNVLSILYGIDNPIADNEASFLFKCKENEFSLPKITCIVLNKFKNRISKNNLFCEIEKTIKETKKINPDIFSPGNKYIELLTIKNSEEEMSNSLLKNSPIPESQHHSIYQEIKSFSSYIT